MKNALLSIIAVMALMFLACGSTQDTNTDEDCSPDKENQDIVNDSDLDQTDTLNDTDTVESGPDKGSVDEKSDEDSGGGCARLDSTFLEPKYDQYMTLRQTGKIFNYDEVNAEGSTIDSSAVASESVIKLDAVTMEGTWGSYLNYKGTTLLAQVQAYDFVKTDESAGNTRIQLLSAMAQFSPQLIPAMIGDGIEEVDFGAFTFVEEEYSDAKFDSSGNITERNIRRKCMVAVSKTEEVEQDGETYDVAIGGIYGCFDDDQVGAVGETLRMMFNLELTDDETAVLEFQNTRQDGTIAKPADDDYTEQCTCYSLYEKDDKGDPAVIDCADFNPDEDLFPDED